MFGGHGFGGGFMWLFWILLIAVIVWALKAQSFSRGKGEAVDKSALEILQDRFARGEIDEEEFERKRKLLSQ
jgi:putative membrane protein